MIPKMRLHVAARALPVPRCGVGKISGVYPYSTAYMTLLQKLKAQFQPRRAVLLSAVAMSQAMHAASLVVTAIERSFEPAGVGLSWQLAMLARHELKGCFFVDPR